MATTDSTLVLTGNTPQNILLGASTSFIVQNVSNQKVYFKIKDSATAGNGYIEIGEKIGFNYDITVHVKDTVGSLDTYALYIVRD